MVIAEATAKLNPAAIAQLPPLDSIKRTIRVERKIELGAPVNPNNTLELEILDFYKVTNCGDFVYCLIVGRQKKQILVLLYNTLLFILRLQITFY